MQARAADDLKRLVTEGLTKFGLDFSAAEAYATPRRLTLVVDGKIERQSYLLRVRDLTKGCCESWLGNGGSAPRSVADDA